MKFYLKLASSISSPGGKYECDTGDEPGDEAVT